ncbi:MAG: peptidyl-alpha-hydroxyglycine alpha-amidating lyase family protein [Chloroflexota bacterium]|nr:peptidyl-alpha-hydroxyglycine alpha-amidating lyase family protein [Chloroflexota bacterium]
MTFELVTGWEQLPDGFAHRDVAGVGVDAHDRVFLITRGEHRVIVYESDGTFVRSWGETIFTPRTHGLTVGPDGAVYTVDDGDHTVRRFTPDGQLQLTLGTPGVPSDTGYDGTDVATITHGGPPFNRPTNVAVAPAGDLYVSDGYGNARVHRFSADGKLLHSWGEPGTGAGQFEIPHGIGVLADGRVLVCDRENDRIQLFSPDGAYLGEWTDVQRPTQVFIARDGLVYVSELWWGAGQRSYVHGEIHHNQYGRVSVLDAEGQLVARMGGGQPGTAGNFAAPHSLAVDSRGDLYVAEVTGTFGVEGCMVPAGTPSFQKFARR